MPGALGVLQGISSAGYDIVLSCKTGMYKNKLIIKYAFLRAFPWQGMRCRAVIYVRISIYITAIYVCISIYMRYELYV